MLTPSQTDALQKILLRQEQEMAEPYVPAGPAGKSKVPMLAAVSLAAASSDTGTVNAPYVEEVDPMAVRKTSALETALSLAEEEIKARGKQEIANVEARMLAEAEELRRRARTPQFEPVMVVIGTTVEAAEKELIQRTLVAYAGNKQAAAKVLGLSRRSLYNKLAKYAEQDKQDKRKKKK